MDLKKEILKEHSKKQMTKVVDYVGDNPNRFKGLIQVFLAGPYRVTQRASWPLSYCVEKHPHLIKPHLKTILDYLPKPDVHDAVKRNIIRLLQYIEIPKKLQGKIADICFGFLQDKKEPVAVRVFSMSVLTAIASENPDLKRELKLIIEDALPHASPAFLSRARKVLKELNQ
jgi:hypothetical protein